MNVVLGISGASGTLYARRLLEVLLLGGHHCHLVFSEAGKAVAGHELSGDPLDWEKGIPGGERLTIWDNGDLFAPFCSGSNAPDAMAVIPCSMGSLARIAAGTADSLLTRAADVCLKERIPLVLVVRETPLNLLHLENMVRVHRAGGTILPACPGFYHRPQSMHDLVDFVAGKILRAIGLEQNLFPKWGT